MAQCVAISGGALVESAADPCTTLLVMTPAEYAVYASSPWNLTPADASEISFLVIGVWLVALLARALIRALYVGDSPGFDEGL